MVHNPAYRRTSPVAVCRDGLPSSTRTVMDPVSRAVVQESRSTSAAQVPPSGSTARGKRQLTHQCGSASVPRLRVLVTSALTSVPERATR